MSETYICPVCGYPGLSEPAKLPGGGPSYDICRSCGFQFGLDDDDGGWTYEAWRRDWVQRGMPWRGATGHPPPADWDPKAQLAALEGNDG